MEPNFTTIRNWMLVILSELKKKIDYREFFERL